MESLSSYNSFPSMDVKVRADRSASSQPEADSARFPDPLADQQNAGRTEQAEDPSQRSSEAAEDGAAKPESKPVGRKDQEKTQAEEGEGGSAPVDSREDESREVGLSNGQVEPDPETVPKGAQGVESVGASGTEKPLPQAYVTPTELPLAPVETFAAEQVMPSTTPLGGEMAQVAMESSATTAGLAAQVAKPQVATQGQSNVDAGESSDVNPLLVDDAPASTQAITGSGQSQDFAQGEGDAALTEILTQVQTTTAPSIDAAIQDARIEAIALDARPAAPVQAVQAVTPSTIAMGANSAQPTEAILTQIQARIQPAMNRAVLRLSPESLGRVAIEVTVNGGEVRAEMRVESADSLQAIQKYIPELKAMFAQADMELSELNLQLDSDGSGFEWEEETPDEQQTWIGRNAAQETNSEAPGGANSAKLSSLEGGLDLIA